MDRIQYELIRSRRKTLAIEIKNGKVIVRAPLRATKKYIEQCITERESWIREKLAAQQARIHQEAKVPKLTMEELNALADQALKVIPERVRYYAPLVGVTYGRITIRNQKTRWGSCSSKGNLNFNCLLMLAPMEVIDSVVVHELCHRKEMNHSPRFYAEVRRVFPEYDKWHGWLKKNGTELMARCF